GNRVTGANWRSWAGRATLCGLIVVDWQRSSNVAFSVRFHVPTPACEVDGRMKHRFQSDFLVIGGGIAGLMFAIRASKFGTVTVLTKAESTEANTAYAQGGIASVWSVHDSFESHIEDTRRAGAGLCDRAAVESIVREGPDVVRELIRLG